MFVRPTIIIVTVLLLATGSIAFRASAFPASQDEIDTKSDWAVQNGFNIDVDSQGFQFPTSIAFVPNPGPSPKDPLYFVTEIRGTIKVVTNDRSVSTFAEDFFSLRPRHELPSGSGEVGMAGVCLAPSEGYVFATFAYQDENNVLRNNAVRFETEPETFSLVPSSQTEFTEVFAPFRSVVSHQIGPCQVMDRLLYINVGDGHQPLQSQRVDALLGKVLRMTLDGNPVPSNPFYTDDGLASAEDYVWALGLRNPFGLKILMDKVFVADNGPSVDRFVRVTEGSNQLWSQSDNLGIGSNADLVIAPGEGVAQLDFYPSGSTMFPARFRDSFYLTVSGSSDQQIPNVPSVLMVPYDLRGNRLSNVPSPFVHYQGSGAQVIAALAFGPDALYFAPLFPSRTGATPVLRVTYDPDARYPHLIGGDLDPFRLMDSNGCFACHAFGSRTGGTIGPNLDTEQLVKRLSERLNSAEYLASIEVLDAFDDEPFVSFRENRQEILEADGAEKITLWLESRIQEPRFDDPGAQMPNLGLSKEHAASIAAFLAGLEVTADNDGPIEDLRSFVGDRLPNPPRQQHLIYFFAVGLLLSGLALTVGYFAFNKLRSRRNRPV